VQYFDGRKTFDSVIRGLSIEAFYVIIKELFLVLKFHLVVLSPFSASVSTQFFPEVDKVDDVIQTLLDKKDITDSVELFSPVFTTP
jgi:hypothetical protein